MNGETDSSGICSSCGKSQPQKQPNDCALPLQTIIHGRYLIGSVLGQGGFGITYVAYDLAEHRRIVIKELYPVFLVQRTPGDLQITGCKNKESFIKYRNRFIEEAQLIYTFRSTPEIVDVYHIFVENGTGYYTMEYLDGQTLQKYIGSNGGKLTWTQLKPIIKDIVNALRVVHKSGSIHRDISPDNIFLSRNSVAKLIDFGSARCYRSENRMTQILKKGFAPWEQYQSNGLFGPWTDIYALAATIYICLTGKMVPEAPSRVLSDSLVSPNECGANLPFNVDRAVMQALSIFPKQRFQTIEAFATALGVTESTILSEPPRIPPSQPKSQPQPESTSGARWQIRCVCGYYAGMKFPFKTNITIGRDPQRCSLIFPAGAEGISGMHLTLLYGSGPSFPGIRCESAGQTSYINGTAFGGRGHIRKLQNGDRISFGNNQIFIVERLS